MKKLIFVNKNFEVISASYDPKTHYAVIYEINQEQAQLVTLSPFRNSMTLGPTGYLIKKYADKMGVEIVLPSVEIIENLNDRFRENSFPFCYKDCLTSTYEEDWHGRIDGHYFLNSQGQQDLNWGDTPLQSYLLITVPKHKVSGLTEDND